MSVLRYIGSKNPIMDKIEKFVDKINLTKYIWAEPFCGSLSVSMYFLNRKDISSFHLNDANPHLIRFYNFFRNLNPDKGLKSATTQLKTLSNDVSKNSQAFYSIRSNFNNNHKTMNDAKFVAFFFFLNRTCFNGVSNYNRKGEFNVALGNIKPKWDDLYEKLHDFHSIIYKARSKVYFYNLEYYDFINKIQRLNKPTFYYCDPPYDDTRGTYTKRSFNKEDQQNLGDILSLTNKPFLVHNSNNQFIRSIYSKYKKHNVEVRRTVGRIKSSRNKIYEIIVTNF